MTSKHTTRRHWLCGPMRILSAAPRGATRRAGDDALGDLSDHYRRDIGLSHGRPADPFRHLLRF